ncbi:hypothetical protein SLEP1_g39703 [Rubroshorea leprosula]|uniref:Uncharacterized protein n=1 Tax=Rubroshorea leprosula TaxID=152421 RepID=A0AAV5L1U5_9ROSI|nr:hypothetical protein SLEP1_g39703 [Rubroshorea leprosula]
MEINCFCTGKAIKRFDLAFPTIQPTPAVSFVPATQCLASGEIWSISMNTSGVDCSHDSKATLVKQIA